jgi:cell division protein FtsB
MNRGEQIMHFLHRIALNAERMNQLSFLSLDNDNASSSRQLTDEYDELSADSIFLHKEVQRLRTDANMKPTYS